MGLVTRTAYAAGGTISAAGQNSNENAIVNEFNGNIENVNIKSSAAIAASKLDLSAIAQSLVMSSAIVKMAKGADVASVAGTMTLGDDGNYFDITGTNAITSITAKTAGTVVTLQFDSTATLTDGSNLKLQGNFTGAAEAQITLVSDGTNWFEVSRNNISSPSAAAQSDQETATSTTTYVSPGRQQYHPSAPKAWVRFNGTGTVAIAASYNVTSITDVGTGHYTVNFTTNFSSGNYGVGAFAGDYGGGSAAVVTSSSTPATSSAFDLFVRDSGFSAADRDFVSLIFCGDQ